MGLVINKSKSCMYVNGVPESVHCRLLELAGVEKGVFPMRYLRVSLKLAKCNKHDCACVVEKIGSVISSWGTIHLLFVGHAQLVSLVLFGIRAYLLFLNQ